MKKKIIVLCFTLMYVALGCSVNINVACSEMLVKQGSTLIANNTGYFNFGNIPLNYNQIFTFTIANVGEVPLILTGSNKVGIIGQNKDDFNVSTNQTLSKINPDSETSFSINFYPKSFGKKTATIIIESNDSNNNPYTFVIVGTCTQPAPEMHITAGSLDILCTTGSFDFGVGILNKTTEYQEIRIHNNGNKKLELTGILRKIDISGIAASMFIIDETKIYSEIESGNSTYFKVAFHPTSIGYKTAKISILNNDSDENPYVFNISASCTTSSEINVKQGSIDIPCATGSYNFPETLLNEASPEITFTIENIGSTTLNLIKQPDYVTLTGTSASMFSLNLAGIKDSLGPGETTTFKVKFEPTTPSTLSAMVNIHNNDIDENPYVFYVMGVCIEPEINVKHEGIDIPDGSNQYDFGYCVTGETSPAQVFIIENKDKGDLKLSGSPQKITISGTDQAMFTIDETMTANKVDQGKSTTFTISFKPTSTGVKTATISIANNDIDENPYEFSIRGTGISYSPGLAIGWIGGGYTGWQRNSGTGYSNSYSGFVNPYSVYVDSNKNIYVADKGNHRVCKWNNDGTAIGWIGGGSNGWKTSYGSVSGMNYSNFTNPFGIAVDSAGNIYVADTGNNRISKWDKDGNAIGWIGGGSNGWKTNYGANQGTNYQCFNMPTDVCVDSEGYIYVTDTNNHRVSKWDSSGNAVGWIGDRQNGWKTTNANSSGFNDYQSFANPEGLTLDASGNIYVCDTPCSRVCKWNSQGIAQGWIGGGLDGWQTSTGSTNGSSYKHFKHPQGIAVASNGDIFVSDSDNYRICKWNKNGIAIGWIGGNLDGWQTTNAPNYSSVYRSFYQAQNVAVSSSGYIYVADSYNHRISKWLD